MRSESFDILIVGAGPAGIAAACAASQGGEMSMKQSIAVVDDNPTAGGQIWRNQTNRWIDRFQWTRCRTLNATTIFAAPQPGTLMAEDARGPLELRYERLILATGGRERFLPFPGWTSPRVFGAGGLQAMVKSGMNITGKSVIVAGSGPLLLAVAATLRKQGANVLLIAEQAPWEQLVPFGLHVLGDWSKVRQSIGIKARLIGVPYRTSCWPVNAVDRGSSLRVTLQSPGGQSEIACDYLACGFFLVPNLELAMLLGCDTQAGRVAVDRLQQTTVPGIYAAGEVTGIGGLDKCLIEGQIAGYAAADHPSAAARLFRARAKSHRFAAALQRSFALREELKYLPQDPTIICRCEDIPFSRLKYYETMRDAKLQTRCGMGPCQSRICGPVCQFLFGWQDSSVRAPIFPTMVANLGH